MRMLGNKAKASQLHLIRWNSIGFFRVRYGKRRFSSKRENGAILNVSGIELFHE